MSDNPTHPNPLKDAKAQLAEAGRVLELDAGTLALLGAMRKEIAVAVPIERDNGDIEVLSGYRVQHNVTRGPAKGGVRFSPAANMDEVRALAMWMTWKSALMDLPYGGGKGAVTVDPLTFSAAEKERATRRYTSAIYPEIGPEKDIPAPDMGTDAQTMAWMMDTYSLQRGYTTYGVVTGKPLSLGGSLGRPTATSRGVADIALEALKYKDIEIEGATVAVQGYGKVGSHAARFMADAGCKVVAVSDVFGAIYSEAGLDIRALEQFFEETGSVVGFPGAEALDDGQDILLLPVDALIPAAMEGVITAENADKIQTKLIVEGANGPTTNEADAVLQDRGITVVPDILANAGGVVVSYFEWVQSNQAFWWSEDEVERNLRARMIDGWERVRDFAGARDLTLRTAATSLAVKTVADAEKLRGLYP